MIKFANIKHICNPKNKTTSQRINIGDYAQIWAIDILYEHLGIADEDVVRIPSFELAEYSGETLVLPFNFIRGNYSFSPFLSNDTLGFSSQIIPVFLGLSFKYGFWNFDDNCISYLKNYAPIGCRDYKTYHTLTNFGIQSYLSGCITTIFPRRNPDSQNYDTVYFVDVPESLRKFVPSEKFEKCKFMHHEVVLTKEALQNPDHSYDLAKKIYCEYRDRASLVVTSRLHCALPCIAFGIPVIYVNDYFAYTLDLMPKFIPVYDQTSYHKIDWNPKPIDIEDYKKMAITIAKDRILKTFEAFSYRSLHDFYFPLWKDGYSEYEPTLTGLERKLKSLFTERISFRYAVWGISSVAERVYEYISKNYPFARLVKVIDSYKRTDFTRRANG